ncbi:MAG: hypothetical protein HXY46_15280 [Syntrophaceae bacterium]|nr:hypothetical protein [Syntrophaceae bacterium]
MRKAIIIPIYLRLHRPEELVHSEGLRLAKRAIESLKILEDRDYTLILPVCFDVERGDEEGLLLNMDRALRESLKAIRDGRRLVFTSYNLRDLRGYLKQRGFIDFHSQIGLKGFPNIRNAALLLAQAVSTDVAIFIDSDEVIEDSDYLGIACEHIHQRWRGRMVYGKGGFYVNPDGNILLPPSHHWWRLFWNKTKWMNGVWERILSSRRRLVPTPVLLGGNLVLHRDLFRSVPFDPYIPRGEDTDYLINASQFGFAIYFDKELRVKHLHPERKGEYFYEELRWDIERFLYEREKIKSGKSLDLDPYPGYFLKRSLYPKAILTSLFLSLDHVVKGEWKKAGGFLHNLHLIFRKRDGGWLRYLQFKEDWERAMEAIEKDRLGKILEDCWI